LTTVLGLQMFENLRCSLTAGLTEESHQDRVALLS
jgi:hypothetical protein